MHRDQWLAKHFEVDHARLRKLAYRLLGSATEADDAVQEAWLRLSRSDAGSINNLSGWLTTVVARVCLDMLRARKTREQALEAMSDRWVSVEEMPDLEQEGLVGLALLIVLEKLTPAGRVAFVLHDVFDVPFEEIAAIIGRTPTTARQLASRARRQVRSQSAVPTTGLRKRQQIIAAFLDAVRAGNIGRIVALLDPDVVLRADAFAAPGRTPVEVRGATEVTKGALAFAARTRFATPMLLNGLPGIVVAPCGCVRLALIMNIPGEKICAIEIVSDPARLKHIDFATLE